MAVTDPRVIVYSSTDLAQYVGRSTTLTSTKILKATGSNEIANTTSIIEDSSGNVTIGNGVTYVTISATGGITLRTGSTAAGSAPVKFVSGSLLTVPEAGAIEFLTDDWWATQTTSIVRKRFLFNVGKITTVTDTYIVLTTDETVICNKATAFTVTLPTAVVGQIFNIKNIGAGTVTVDGNSTDLIDDVLTQDIEQWESITLQCYAANKWAIL